MSIGSIRVESVNNVTNGALQTAPVAFAGTGTTAWSAAFFLRINATPLVSQLGGAGFMYNGFNIFAGTTTIRVSPSTPSLLISMACGGGNVFFEQDYVVGQVLHIAFAYAATGTSTIYINGISVATGTNLGASTIGGTNPVGFAPYASCDMTVSSPNLWSGYTLSQSDATNLAAGALPTTISTQPIAYYSLLGTSGTAAVTNDTGLANLGTGGSSYNLHATAVANYSSDVLAVIQFVSCLEAFVTNRSGALILFWLYSTFTSFRIVNDNGYYDRSLSFIQMTAGGSGYTNPTATISGGSPARPATLGPPIVVAGRIVGVPIWDAGDGYAASGATISFSDPNGSGAAANAIVGGQILPVTAVGGAPTVKVNGSVATLNPLDTFEMIDRSTFVGYQFQTPVTPGQSVTYTLPASWATSYVGTSAASATDVVANNYAGAAREPRFILPPQVSMAQGFNHVPDPMTNYSWGIIGQDLSNRFNTSNPQGFASWPSHSTGIGSWIAGGTAVELPVAAGPTAVFSGGGTGAIGVCTIVAGVIQSLAVPTGGTGYPNSGTITFAGGCGGGGGAGTYTASGGIIQTAAITAGGAGYSDGIYTVQWDDTAPQGTGPYTPTTTISLADGNGSLLYVTQVASLSSAGTLAGGILTGITKAYYVQYRPTSAYSYGAAIGMTINGGSGSGPYVNTALDANGKKTWRCTGPQNVMNRSNPVEPDGYFKSLCEFGSGNVIGNVRYMDCTFPGGAVSFARNPADVTQLSDITYNFNANNPTAQVAAIRPYSHSVSPLLYLDTASPGTTYTPGGQPAQYTIPIASDGWLQPFSGSTNVALEFVTSSPHGFGTYQQYNNNIVQPNHIAATNGQLAGSHNPATTITLPGYQTGMFVTGASSFVATYGGPGSTGSTMPGGINNAAYTQGVTGGIVNNSVGALAVGAPGTGYTSGAVPAIAPPAGAWQTALATATTSSGSVNAISQVSGHAGNNYALAPLVTIQPPSSSYAPATVTFDLISGVISNLALTYSGKGFSSVGAQIPISVWGGGSGSGFVGYMTTGTIPIPGTTSTYIGGVSVTLTSGGSNYTYPIRLVVQSPSAIATAHSTIAGGSVNGLVLDTAGSSYPTGFVPWVLVDAPAQQAILSPTLSSGSLSGLTVVYGGLGHVTAPEIVVLGNGTNAAATAVLTGTVVTGTTGLVAGSGYTGTNPIAVGVAPPARQAIGTYAVSGGALQSGAIVDPGCGYPALAPAVAVVGAGSGATSTASMVFPFNINMYVKDGGCIPFEVAAGFNAALPGSGCWFNFPMAATDALATAIVTSVASYTAAGDPLWPEYVNEHWNNGFPFGYNFTVASGNVKSSLGTTTGDSDYYRDAFYVANTANLHALTETYLASIGRGGDLVRIFGSWGAGSRVTANMVAYANQFSVRMDAVAIGPYWTISDETCLQYAAASVIADLPQSLAFGTSWATTWRWTRDMYHDLLRNLIICDASYVGTGTGGSPAGYFASHQQALAAYNLVSGQTSRPQLVAYEAAISQWVPNEIAPGYTMTVQARPYNATALLELDLFHDPGMYDAGLAFFQMQAAGGLTVSNYFQVQNEIFDPDLDYNQNPWTLVLYGGQQPGMGDGSDGRATNLFWMNDNTIPGAGSTAAKYTTFMEKGNCSPLVQSFIDYGKKFSASSPSPTLTVSPTSATVAPSGTQSITATLSNSSAGLAASATHGTVSTATPTSGTPFTYTAPSSGTTDTVTVADSTDSLTASVAITISSPTPTPTPAPTVVSTVPTANATIVAANTTATATFNEAIAPSSLAFSLTPTPGSTPVAGSTLLGGGNTIAGFAPRAPLAYSQLYTASVRATAADGTPMSAATTWTFTTGDQPPVATGYIRDLCWDFVAGTITSGLTITAVANGSNFPGTVTVTGTNPITATFVPTSRFVVGTKYIFTIQGATAADGTPMVAETQVYIPGMPGFGKTWFSGLGKATMRLSS